MVEEVSLRVGIDARPAAAGADSFKRSATEIIRSAEKMGRAVGRAGGGFDTLKKSANDNSLALAKTASLLGDVEKSLRGLSRNADQMRTLDSGLIGLGEAAASTSQRINEAASSSKNRALVA